MNRSLLGVLGVALTAASLAHAVVALGEREPASQAIPPVVASVTGVGITVHDLDASVAFYRDVLGFEKTSEREEAGEGIERLTGVFGVRRRTAVLRLGGETVELSDYLAPEGRPIPPDARSNDRWFQHIAIVVADMDAAYAHLRRHNVRHASTGPQTLPDWNPNAGGIKAFYFKDPDAHPLELIWFPEAKGDPKWRQLARDNPSAMFLGIGHTAIVVRDTEVSLAFYERTLGMRIAGASENYGTEQEHLNNVFGARLRITGLRAEQGMGVELLEYLAPTTGRAAPSESGAHDLWHTHTLMTSPEKDAGQARLRGTSWVSPGAQDPDADGEQPLQILVRDPDGHAVLVRAAPSDTRIPPHTSGNERASRAKR